eukprot:COSAG02_NODE_643_length_19037_cov_9.951632_7_plen_102_part_00
MCFGAGERTVLALPEDAGSIVAPASMPYAVEVCSVAGMLPAQDGVSDESERLQLSLCSVLCVLHSLSLSLAPVLLSLLPLAAAAAAAAPALLLLPPLLLCC